MRDVHLAAYKDAGFNVAAIASRNPAKAREAAKLRGPARPKPVAGQRNPNESYLPAPKAVILFSPPGEAHSACDRTVVAGGADARAFRDRGQPM